MRIAVSILWLVFAVVFVALGWAHWTEAERSTPPFELTQRGYKVFGSGFEVEIDVGGTPLDQPFENFTQEFNTYLQERDQVQRDSNRRAAWGYFLAAATAIACLLLEQRGGRALRLDSDVERAT